MDQNRSDVKSIFYAAGAAILAAGAFTVLQYVWTGKE